MSVRIRPLERKDCATVARLHNQYISVGTLNTLGDNFTELIFQTLVGYPAGFCLIAEDNGRIVGFVAGTANIQKFYHEFFRRYPLQAAFYLSKQIFNLDMLKKMFRLARYPFKPTDLPDAEGLSFVVIPEYRIKGLAILLLQHKVAAFKAIGVEHVRIGIHASLTKNQKFFEQIGAELKSELHWSDQDKIKLYMWDLSTFKLNVSV